MAESDGDGNENVRVVLVVDDVEENGDGDFAERALAGGLFDGSAELAEDIGTQRATGRVGMLAQFASDAERRLASVAMKMTHDVPPTIVVASGNRGKCFVNQRRRRPVCEGHTRSIRVVGPAINGVLGGVTANETRVAVYPWERERERERERRARIEAALDFLL